MTHEKNGTADPDRRRRGGASLLDRFMGNRKGTTAIEFTALALPFCLLVFAILESCISFAGQELLANATYDVARQIRTGQLKPADLDEDKLHDLLCERLELLVAQGCPGLSFDLEQYDTFADAARVRTAYTDDGELDTSGFKVDPGPSMSKNMLRVYYEWPVITDFMSKSLSNLKDGNVLHFATVTWQNEPFDD